MFSNSAQHDRRDEAVFEKAELDEVQSQNEAPGGQSVLQLVGQNTGATPSHFFTNPKRADFLFSFYFFSSGQICYELGR